MNNFDGIAWCYDPLKKLVFGNKLDQAATHLFSGIPVGSKVLVIGGGSGKILDGAPEGIKITYLEKSKQMIKKARRRPVLNIEFVHFDFLEYQPPGAFDYVMCPFFLDLFDPERMKSVIHKIRETLTKDGRLLVADFAFQHSNLLKLMYFGFRVVSNIPAKSIPPIHDILLHSEFKLMGSANFLNGLVFSNQYGYVKTD